MSRGGLRSLTNIFNELMVIGWTPLCILRRVLTPLLDAYTMKLREGSECSQPVTVSTGHR